ncbi:MAG: ketoacyl-ACP synthase, partial [Actinomycetota bacterium]|nr:ketoacyl-ACP synthase [Actinomycetota bacterium]
DVEECAGNQVDEAVIGTVEVVSRHVHDETETIDAMAAQAAGDALRQADVGPGDVDLLVLGNWSERQFIPEIAPQVALRLGAVNALAFDVCGACTGFVHGTQIAASLLSAHHDWDTAVVVCSEHFSSRVRPGSKGELIVGDAAGAVVLRKGLDEPRGLIDSLLISDGESAGATGVLPPRGWIKSRPDLVGLGIKSHVETCRTLLERNGLTTDDIDWFVPHPGTTPMHEGVRDALGIAPEKFVTNFTVRANTGSASIPIVLSEYRDNGTFSPGDLVLASAVGSGWYYGGLLVRL